VGGESSDLNTDMVLKEISELYDRLLAVVRQAATGSESVNRLAENVVTMSGLLSAMANGLFDLRRRLEVLEAVHKLEN